MKKILSIALCVLSVSVSAQTNIVQAKRIVANDSLRVADKAITTISDDVTMTAGSPFFLATQYAIKNFVLGNKFRFVVSATQPADTSVIWIDLNYKRLEAAPLRFRVNGAWTLADSVTGPHYDFVGGVISNGTPYKIVVSGQSNPGGPYGSTLITPPFYDGSVGDTLASPYVTGWNDSTGKWEIGHIRMQAASPTNGGPWQYSTGENYVFDLAKLLARQYGRSVRVVMDVHGGEKLDKWAGTSSGYPDTSVYFLMLKNKIVRSGIGKPSLFIWGHGEAGIDSVGKNGIYYYDKLKQLIGALRSNSIIDSNRTTFLTHSIGDTIQRKATVVSSNSSEGGLRSLNSDGDYSTGYVDTRDAQSDGLHYTWRGHRVIAMRLFGALPQFPRLDEPVGFRRIGTLTAGILDTLKMVTQSSKFTDANGTPFIDFNTQFPFFQNPTLPSGATSLAGLFLNSNNSTAYLRGFMGQTLTADALSGTGRFVANSPIYAGTGGFNVGGVKFDGFNQRADISLTPSSNSKEFHLHNDNGVALILFGGGVFAEQPFKFDVRGRSQIRLSTGTATGMNFPLRVSNTPTTSPSPGAGVGVEFQQRWNSDNDTTKRTLAQVVAIGGDTTRASFQGDIAFNTSDNGAMSEKLRIKSDGKIGIGTSTPSATLDVNGAFRLRGSGTPGTGKVLTSSDANGNAVWQTPTLAYTGTVTLSNQTNITSSSIVSAIYTRAGDGIHVVLTVNIQPASTATTSVLYFSLPASTTSTVGSGSVVSDDSGTGIALYLNSAQGQIRFKSTNASSNTFVITYDYLTQ